jgi:integrase
MVFFGRFNLVMAQRKAGYKRGQKYIKNLRLYTVQKSGHCYWRLRTPHPSGTGFLERQFSDQAQAVTAFELARIEHGNHGLAASQLGAKERGDALAALDILRPFGVSLVRAAEYYAGRHRNITESETVEGAVSALLVAKAKKRSRYRKDLKNRLERFALDFGQRKIAEIERPEIIAWLSGLGVEPITRDSYRLRLSTLWGFARLHHWTIENIIREIPIESGGSEGTIEILSVEELARLLVAASPETLPYWIFGAFCGLRSAEIERLEWKDVQWAADQIVVQPPKSKTASRRSIRIRPNALRWLAPYRTQRVGPVIPRGLRKRLERDRTNAKIETWKPNALRHSFCSYALEAEKDLKTLAYEMGHTDPDLLYRHYREMVTPEAAKKYWNLIPIEGPAESNIVELKDVAAAP